GAFEQAAGGVPVVLPQEVTGGGQAGSQRELAGVWAIGWQLGRPAAGCGAPPGGELRVDRGSDRLRSRCPDGLDDAVVNPEAREPIAIIDRLGCDQRGGDQWRERGG